MAGDDVEKTRKQRSIKACDRCRLKKVKCCGSVPCLRCRQDDAICEYGIRRSSEGKSVSAAHVNQLQMHNELLVKAIKKLWVTYARPALGEDGDDIHSLHDIIQRTGVLDESSARQLQQTDRAPLFAPEPHDDPTAARSRQQSNSSSQAGAQSHYSSQQHQYDPVHQTVMHGGSQQETNLDAFDLVTALDEDYYYSDNNVNDGSNNEVTDYYSGSRHSSSTAYSFMATPAEASTMVELCSPPAEGGVTGIKRANKPKNKLVMPPSYVPPHVNSGRLAQVSVQASSQATTFDSFHQVGSSTAMDDATESWEFK